MGVTRSLSAIPETYFIDFFILLKDQPKLLLRLKNICPLNKGETILSEFSNV
jgi:hypothetical protein